MSRHASLAEQLKTLMAYRNRPEVEVPEVETNWEVVADNDNAPETLEGLHTERRSAIRPTLGEIAKSIASNDVERNDARQIVRIGNIRFSDGSQTERAYKYGADKKIIEFDAPMPVGAMLGTSDRQERVLGGEIVASNAGYTEVYGGKHSNKVIKKSKETKASKSPEPPRTRAEMRAEIEALPSFPVTVCKKGFPWKPSNLRELFMGLEKGKKGESGSIAWEDISTHIVEREVWHETLAALSVDDRKTLDVAMTARTLREIGEAHGFIGKRAERMGKKILHASNDNLSSKLKKSAA